MATFCAWSGGAKKNNTTTKKESTTASTVTTTTEPETTTEQPTVRKVELPKSGSGDVNFLTADGNLTEYNGKNSAKFSVNYPSDWTLDYTVFSDSKPIKTGEVVGLVVKGATKPFDDVNIAQDEEYGVKYTDRGETEISGKTCYTAYGVAPVEFGEWNFYSYALDMGDYYARLTFYSVNEVTDFSTYYSIIDSLSINWHFNNIIAVIFWTAPECADSTKNRLEVEY